MVRIVAGMSKQVVFITGANRGIGLQFVKMLKGEVQHIYAAARTLSPELESLLSDSVEFVKLDLTSSEDIKKLAQLKTEKIDWLINNAGIFKNSEFSKLSEKEILESVQTNAVAPLLVFQQLLPLLKKSPRPIVANITSLMGSIKDNSGGSYYAYRMSKAALNMANKSMSIDFPTVTSVVLHPGWVQTDMGGPNAKITKEESVTGLLKVIRGLKSTDSGSFINYNGESLPW